MPVKSNLTKKIECQCKTTTVVDVEPATAYCKLTRFMCACGRTYHILDYYNAITTYREVSEKEDNSYLEREAQEAKWKKIGSPTEEGRRKYQSVDKWLNAQSVEFIAGVERQRTFHQMIDREFVIETILEHCRYEDNLLNELYEQYILSLVPSLDFHATKQGAFVEKQDWYIISITDFQDGKISRIFSSKEDAETVVEKLEEDRKNHNTAYTIISVPKGTKISI